MVKRLLLLLLLVSVFLVSVEDVRADCLGTWAAGICYDDESAALPCNDRETSETRCYDPVYGGDQGCAWVDSRRQIQCAVEWSQVTCESFDGCYFVPDIVSRPPEICDNGFDDDGDGLVDLNDPNCDGCNIWYRDQDRDGWSTNEATTLCNADSKTGWIRPSNPFDCQDSIPAIHPGAPESCDNWDNDCNGLIDNADIPGICGVAEVCNGLDDDLNNIVDDGLPFTTYYRDGDDDGYGDCTDSIYICSPPPSGYVTICGDCNPANPNVHPGAAEICDNGIDNDCNGATPDGSDEPGYGNIVNCGIGECAATGSMVCIGSSIVAQCTSGTPVVEQCTDNRDNDCDGQIDDLDNDCAEGVYYCDGDSDGHISATVTDTCLGNNCAPSGCFETAGGDCNDGNSNIGPHVLEQCNNGVDDDCDVSTPDICPLPSTWYRDIDGDGYHSLAQDAITAPGSDWYPATSGFDCNDNNGNVNPGELENCGNGVDDDCDPGTSDTCPVDPIWYRDVDGDGYHRSTLASPTDPGSQWYSSSNGFDCNDNDGNINPGEIENCGNGVDDDCDPGTSDTCPAIPTWYYDFDGDNYHSATQENINTPLGPWYLTSSGLDCDDNNPGLTTNCPPPCVPTGAEICDAIDNDCDGQVNENGVCTPVTYYCNIDGDSAYSSTPRTCIGLGCEPPGCITGSGGGDCNDYNSLIYPGATEVCDAVDNDCDGQVNENGVCTPVPYFCNIDGDIDRAETATDTCIGLGCNICPATPGNDCNDYDGSINTGAVEVCDAVDNDCDGQVNENGVCTPVAYYCDGDGDGYDDINSDGVCIGLGCEADYGCSAIQGNDCNDANGAINPGATEQCNNYDDNCNGLVDTQEGPIGTWYYEDRDSDGFGSGARTNFCFDPGGYFHLQGELSYTDCNDLRNDIYPGATEYCDGYDNDCNGPIDDGLTPPLADLQAGVCLGATKVCGGFSGWLEPNYALYSSDYEAGSEVSCDYLDNDCDGPIDETLQTEYFRDDDGDQWLTQIGSRSECFDPGPDWYTYGELFQPATDGLWDQDDTDPIITYEACGSYGVFIIEKNALLGDYPSAVADDWSYDNVIKPPSSYETDQFRGGCVPNSNYCVYRSDLYDTNGVTVGSGGTFDGSAFGHDENMFCSGNFCDAYGCAWLDYDSDPVTCGSNPDYQWIEPGTNYAGIGEYDGLQTECCGDDGAERISVQSCLASTVDAPICCPNDGQDWFNLDGECVTACPDIMNSDETFISLNPASEVYQGFEISLAGNSNGYCCNGVEGPTATKPLCQVGEEGCFISSGIPGTQDNIQARKEYCQATPGDNFCMVETCLEGNAYQACEVFASCNDEVNTLNYGNADQKLICSGYSTNPLYVANGNYFTVDASCSPAQIQNCEEVTREVCSGTGCQALCQKDENGNPYNCQEVCSSYSCQTVTSYHGGECQIDPACNPTIELERSEDVIDASVSGCSDFGTCNQFGCAATACDIYGCPPSPQLFERNTLCEENFYCTDLSCVGGANNLNEPNMRCFTENAATGNPFVINITESSPAPVLDNTYYRCNPTDDFEEGDPWCDYVTDFDEVVYDEFDNRCEFVRSAVCDYSAVNGGNIQPESRFGCHDPLLTGDDYWNQYDSDCVGNSGVGPANTYDVACCLAFTIDDYEVYDNEITEGNIVNGIRVY